MISLRFRSRSRGNV